MNAIICKVFFTELLLMSNILKAQDGSFHGYRKLSNGYNNIKVWEERLYNLTQILFKSVSVDLMKKYSIITPESIFTLVNHTTQYNIRGLATYTNMMGVNHSFEFSCVN